MKTIPATKKDPLNEAACLWTKAGVIEREPCETAYQCASCDFDRRMRKAAQANQRARAAGKQPKGTEAGVVFWKDRLRELPPGQRPCQHHLKGQIEFRSCINDYHCLNCSFDQYFNDQYSIQAVLKPVEVLEVEGIKLPQGFYFHRGHTWIRIEEGAEVRVGIDDFAFHLLGAPDRLETPLIGKTVEQGREAIEWRRGSQSARLLSPISGVVTAIHAELRDQAVAAEQHPYTEGWVMRVHATDLRRELKALKLGVEMGELLQRQWETLYRLIDDKAHPLAADGGQLQRDIYGNCPDIGWERLVQTFLR